MERKWNANGTQLERNWNANGTRMERIWERVRDAFSVRLFLSSTVSSFSLIGLTETKYKISEEVLSNHAIPGYSFVSQPSLSNAGGAGFFVSDKSLPEIWDKMATDMRTLIKYGDQILL